MTQKEIIDFWKQSSDHDFQTMSHLFESGDYMWSLFIGHLVIEKLMKAYFVKMNDENYPRIHNLLRIAEKSGMELSEDQQEFFSAVTSFNINARYDDYKQSFYRRCNAEFTRYWIEKITVYREWIKSQL